ncbi:MAG: hypothetical protein A3G81_30895 [Betaproteobacteria bacterium RIFCSPLOWO2_12_FULL_65_14]|nr:MAG: hypothetical protein A3G81_30895 [Betaproteobacteria bacterium RIFCSPLOWO2_12_FULL_65_14]
MVTNAGLVAGVIVGLALLVAGIVLLKRSASGGVVVSVGALLFLGAEVYGTIVLRPFIGRPFDEQWHQQIATVEAVGMLGLLLCAAGMVAHALKLKRA